MEEHSIDKSAMVENARASNTGEHFQELVKGAHRRLGVGTRLVSREPATFFIEVMLNPCPGPDVDLSGMERIIHLLRKLEARGFVIRCEDDGTIVCELLVTPDEVEESVRQITSFLE